MRDCRKLADQIIANEYFPGRGISAHVDCIPRFDDAIGSISLLSACEMFSRSARTGTCAVLQPRVLQPRSGGLPTDSGRFDWTHEVSARKSDIVTGVRTVRSRRISLTFRKVIASTST
ncbi:alpha-ketoglutarate-dependent dioxygenase AlkB [Agrobacterium sp. DE0009]|uniref:alpha-ketoglutarate-dependent dioxygenase AlkB n=1 Tax=Agrobacterium sp. DE0009 TaxID=2587505 RepID=UPI001FEF410B